MGTAMVVEVKCWTANRKSALALDILQGKTTVAEASCSYDLPPSETKPAFAEPIKAMIEDNPVLNCRTVVIC